MGSRPAWAAPPRAAGPGSSVRAALLALTVLAVLWPAARWPAAFAASGRRPQQPRAAELRAEALQQEGHAGSLLRDWPATDKSYSPWVPVWPQRPDLPAFRDAVGTLFVQLCALALGCLVGVGAALADVRPDVENVDAALGFVKRNYYDQSFNGQDWEALRAKYLARAEKGEGAARLTRELVGSLGDRYSRVIDKDAFERLMAYDPLGIGVVLTRNDKSEVIISSPPFADSAAAKAGIRQGDIVDSIDGASFAKESLFAIMDRVAQGDAPQAKLALRRDSADAPSVSWEETIPRARSPTPQSKVDSGVVPAAGAGGHRVGYLRLKNFGARSALDMAQALEKVRAEGADELVLDLRGNLGGSFQAALEIAALFLEPNLVATHVQTPAAGDKPLKVNGNAGSAQEPLVVLVDQQSASASEVLAAALRGNCRAPLLGSQTYGKAKVQGVFGLPNREAIALTVARYSGPSGLAIGDGLRPDGAGPVGMLGRAAAATGLSLDLAPSDYAAVDFASGRGGAFKSCAAERA